MIPADRIVDDEATDDALGPSGHNASEFMDDTHDLPLDLSVSRTRETEQTLALQPTPTLNEYLVRKRWTFLGAWLRLTAYNQTRYEKDSHVLPSSRVQNATIMEIDVHTRFLAGEFQIMWGFLNGRASLVASLALPNIISNKPDPMISAISVGDLFTVRNLISEGRYQPIDESEVGSSLLQVSHACFYNNRSPHHTQLLSLSRFSRQLVCFLNLILYHSFSRKEQNQMPVFSQILRFAS